MGEVDIGLFGWSASNELEQRLERLVLGLTYADGWTFVLGRGVSARGAYLKITWEVDDVDCPDQRTLVQGGATFRPEVGDPAAFQMFLYDVWRTIEIMEAHERIELLRFNGETLWDPHPPGSRGKPLVCSPDFSAPLPDAISERIHA